ncbi:hypothetical protein ABDZ32_16175 [Aeromonas veronii]|uniref:hypothetical protein n=1 Tax=Aeromonas veronii TaxID=654 RepID=UPI0031FCB5AC
MLPPKIQNFLRELTTKTINNEYSWGYDDNNSVVFLQTVEFSISLRYSFNEIEEVGEFVIFYQNSFDNKEYRFYTSQFWDDYDIVRRLFDIAQSSGLRLPF